MTERIGFIGVGNMGWPMAANLARAGRAVTVFDVNQEQAARFAGEYGASHAKTLQELGAAADIVITMLPDGKVVRRVMLEMEDGGLAPYLAPGSLLIDMSSSDPLGTRELGTELQSHGLKLMDAPVSGGLAGARDGTLTIMMGGDDADSIERARPVLACLGKRLFETGPLGSGHAMKALNNFVAGAGFVAAAEALITGRRFGLDPAVIVDILNVSTGRNFTTETVIGTEVLNGRFATGFALALLAKDIRIAADLAGGLGLDAPLMQLSNRRWSEALAGLGGGKDFTEAFRYWESVASGEKS